MKTSAFMSWAMALGTALSFALAGTASAADIDATATPDKLVAAAKSRLWMCNLYAKAALVHLDARREAESQSALEELLAKIRESKENFAESYIAVRSKLDGGNKEATNALNDYAAFVLAAFDAAAIRASETQATYDRRVADVESELATKANGFKQRLSPQNARPPTPEAARPAAAATSAKLPAPVPE